MSFYITLPSNSSIEIFKNNKQNNFTTQFKEPLNLDGIYEVALVEFRYTESIFSKLGNIKIKIDNFHLKLGVFIYENELINDFVQRTNNQIEEEFFISYCLNNIFTVNKINEYFAHNDFDSKDILDYSGFLTEIDNKDYILEENFNETLSKTDFKYLTKSCFQKIKKLSDLNKKEIKLSFIQNILPNLPKLQISNILKIDFRVPINTNFFIDSSIKNYFQVLNNKLFITRNQLSKNQLIENFFVITDIIEPQVIGDTFDKVLATISTTGGFQTINSIVLSNPHYFKLNKTYISTINIKLVNTIGKEVKFFTEKSKVIVKLHFRKVK